MTIKKYRAQNVFDAAQERLNYVFDEFEHIYVSFSSGKDSGVVLNQCIDIARRRGRKFHAVFIDLEAFYQKSAAFVEKMFTENEDVLIPMWVCLPMTSPNSLSYFEPTWVWWDEEKRPIWVRDMPKNKWVINLSNNPFDWYVPKMTFEDFIKHIGETIGHGEKTACLVGIRTDESLNRFRAIAGNKETYKSKRFSTKVSENVFNFYPIYDWAVEDIWTYNARFAKPYNPIYDLMYLAGVPIHQMRIDEPFGNEAKAGLAQFKVIEPDLWGKLVNRVSGANFGNIYSGSKIMSNSYKLPKNYTWTQFTEFLLTTLPPAAADNYRDRFTKFIAYWRDVGCPVPDEQIEILEAKYGDTIINTRSYGTRGAKDKYLVKFREPLDELPELEGKDDFCTWRRMAMCIIKNDFVCKGLSFSITKEMKAKRDAVLAKFRSL